jgi:riboflavin biosynthesis pyrimidine reductase
MGGGAVTAALAAGLVDEVVLHQVPVLLGGGRPFFRGLPGQVRLRLVPVCRGVSVEHRYLSVSGIGPVTWWLALTDGAHLVLT